MKRIAFLLGILTFSNAHAQNDTVDLNTIEVKATRASATAPFAKTNISKSSIEVQNLGQDLPFLLNNTPSVVVNSDAGNGVGYTGIRIRGTDATRINVTLNGVPFNDAESGGAFFVNLPDIASSVNSIQIQRGVGTSTNGAGAFGATLNLSTNETFLKPHAQVSNSYGSFDTWKNTVQAGTGLWGKHFTTDLRLSHIQSNGYIDRAKTDMRSYYFSQAYIRDKATVRLNIFSGHEKTYQAWYGVRESDLRTNRRINYAGTEKADEPYDNETDNYTQTHYQLFYNQKLSQKLVLNTGLFFVNGYGYYEQYKAAQKYADYGLSNAVAGNDTLFQTDLVRQLWLDNDFYGTLFSLQHQGTKNTFIFGGAATKYVGSHFGRVVWAQNGFKPGPNYYNLDGDKDDVNLYAKWQQNLWSGLQLFVDVQWRHVGYALRGFRANPDINIYNRYNFFNPKLGFSYSHNNLLYFASYSIANKEPNRDDFEAGLNEQPRPEHLRDLELGVTRKNSKTTIGATFYYMQYKNQLVLTGKVNDVGAYTRTNIEDSYRAGLELEGSTIVTPWLTAMGNFTISRNRINNFKEFIDDYDNGDQKINNYAQTNIAFSPAAVGSGTLVVQPAKKLSLYFISKYVGKQYLDNTSNEARKIDAYFTQDARAMYTLDGKKWKNITLIAQVANIFNTLYNANGYTFSYYSNAQLTTENYYFPMAGINWNVGVTIKL